MQRKFLILFSAALLAAAVIHLGKFWSFWRVSQAVLQAIHWIPIVLLMWHAVRSKSLTTWILVCMIAGAEFGEDFPAIAVHLNVISRIFLNMVKTIIAPLIFATLVVGIAGHSNLKQVGRMGWKSIFYFEIISTIALFVGLIVINISQAGSVVNLPASMTQESLTAVQPQKWDEVIVHIFPENIAKSIYEGQILQVVIFSIVFGIAVALLKEDHRRRMISFTESLSETMFKFTNVVMYLAPLAVFAAIAFIVGSMGLGILNNLVRLLASLYMAFILFLTGVLMPVAFLLKIPVKKFILAIAEPATLAFATTSSESALPSAMEAMEKFGVPRKIVAFVMPIGYSFNLDGTTLYLSLATIFVAQVSGIHLPLAQQLIIIFTLMFTSKGAAGVPRAALVILLGTAASFGLPSWPVFIILGIDILMDMGRSAINVIGNCLAAAVIARWEGEFDQEKAMTFTTDKIE